tara:strand:- start:26 stop:283 length:258 start_codon:yes stop_codon:yes gene_type:complete
MSNQFDDIEYADKPTVYLGTLKAGNRFWFRGDWRTDAGVYTVDEPLDEDDICHRYPVVKEFKVGRSQGLWFPNVSVVPIDKEEAS